MMEQKIDPPPNLGFWTLALAYFQIMNATSQKNQLSASETEVKKDTKSAKIKKKLIVSQIFDMMEQKIDPPNLGFWALTLAYFQFINATSQKNHLSASETEVKKDTKSAKIKKI